MKALFDVRRKPGRVQPQSTIGLHREATFAQGRSMKQGLCLALILLAGCAQLPNDAPPAGPPVPPPANDTCGAGAHGALIGQDVTALERVLILGQVRIIRPGQPVTMDYRAERINFNIGADETIVQITCG